MAAVSRLALSAFRSYADALIEPGPAFVLLYGENGAGKTNLLEAVSLLSPGRGLRGAALTEMARVGASGAFAVAARVGDIMLAHRMGVESTWKSSAVSASATPVPACISGPIRGVPSHPALSRRLWHPTAPERLGTAFCPHRSGTPSGTAGVPGIE